MKTYKSEMKRIQLNEIKGIKKKHQKNKNCIYHITNENQTQVFKCSPRYEILGSDKLKAEMNS